MTVYTVLFTPSVQWECELPVMVARRPKSCRSTIDGILAHGYVVKTKNSRIVSEGLIDQSSIRFDQN
jgi:hypothetical protein